MDGAHVIFGACGLAMAPVIWYVDHWKCTTVDRRVSFLQPNHINA